MITELREANFSLSFSLTHAHTRTARRDLKAKCYETKMVFVALFGIKLRHTLNSFYMAKTIHGTTF